MMIMIMIIISSIIIIITFLLGDIYIPTFYLFYDQNLIKR